MNDTTIATISPNEEPEIEKFQWTAITALQAIALFVLASRIQNRTKLVGALLILKR